MNTKEANQYAKDKWGPYAGAVRASNKDRHQRFGFVMVDVGGALDKPILFSLGYGDSFESALKMAESNEVAINYAKKWEQTKKDYEEFKLDPTGYYEKKKKEIEEKLNNG